METHELTLGRADDAASGGARDAARDLAEALQYRLALETLLTTTSSRLMRLPSESIDEGVLDVLQKVAAFLCANRAQLFLFSQDGARVECTHEWHAEGVGPAIAEWQGRPTQDFPWAQRSLAAGETLCFSCLDELPVEAASERTALEREGIHSFLLQPIMVGSELIGAAEFESVRKPVLWNPDAVKLARLTGEAIGNALARQRAQQELRASEEKYRGLVEEINEVIFSLDTDSTVTYVSPAVERMGGYKPSEVIGRPFLDFIHPEDLPTLVESYRDLLAGRFRPAEYRVLAKSGETRWVRTASRAIRRDDRVVGIRAVLMDITERKTTELALAARERRWRSLIERSSDGIVMFDADDVVSYASPGALKVLGLASEEVLGHRCQEFVHPEDQPGLGAALARQRPIFGGSFALTLRLRCSGGSWRWVEAVGTNLLDDPSVGAMVVNYRDVTDTRVAGQELMQKAREQGALAGLARKALAMQHLSEVYSETARIIVETTACDDCMVFERSSEEEVRLVASVALAGSVGVRFRLMPDTPLLSALESNQPLLVRKGDTSRWSGGSPYMQAAGYVSAAFLPMRSGDRCRGAMVVLSRADRDYSFDQLQFLSTLASVVAQAMERRRAEQEVASLNQTLEQRVAERTAELGAANKELETFSYSVSHDLRSPLRTIDAWSQVLLDEYRDQLRGEGPEMLAQIRRAVHRMGRLIDDLLALARVSRGKLRREPVDLSALARTVMNDLRRLEPQREAEIVVAEGAVAVGDPGLLRVVFENLIGNAWKFSSKCARTRIEFGWTAGKPAGESPIFFVRDNGAGFDMRFVAKLFGPFQRLHGVTEFPGTGIGLATVHRIVERHGGRIWADAALDRGATFFFTLER